MAVAKLDTSLTIFDDNPAFDELERSIPEAEKQSVLRELDLSMIARRTAQLKEELATLKLLCLDVKESRTLFLAALRGVMLQQISVAQLATLHILDSAIRTLYTNPMVYIKHRYADQNGEIVLSTTAIPIAKNGNRMPTSVRRFPYELIIIPSKNIQLSDLPLPMQRPLLRRFFNFTDSEWAVFCKEMKEALSSEQAYHVLNAPQDGCWSGLISRIQQVLKCMGVLDWMVDSKEGLITEKIMVIPSFSMFQAALNAKAHTLKRNPVQLIPTYGYIEAGHYAELRALGKIALALYLPEATESMRYQYDQGRYLTTIDGYPFETTLAGAIHDVYHAMREMAMSENVAKARMRLASIAKAHPKNRITPDSRAVDDVLVDGELIFSYPPEVDTMFDPDFRSPGVQIFGMIFHISALKNWIHPDLKRAFIEDMVKNKALWQERFGLGKADLLIEDQRIYDEICAKSREFSTAQAISNLGLLSAAAKALSNEPASPNTPKLHG